MIKKEKEMAEHEIIKDVICNMCGKSCKPYDGFDHGFSCATLTAHWGYFSDNRDGEIHEAHLCQKCWEKITKDFVCPDLIATDQL